MLGTQHSFLRCAAPHCRYRLETVSVLIRVRAGCAGGVRWFSGFREMCSGAPGEAGTPPFLVGDFSSPFVFMVTLFLLDFGFCRVAARCFVLFDQYYVNGVSLREKSFLEFKI